VVFLDSRILILGSLPSDESLRLGQYYANPRNHFWRLLSEVYGETPGDSYDQRLEFLRKKNLALWDVIGSAVRRGSLDSSIKDAAPNDLARFLDSYPHLRTIGLNGRKAGTLFKGSVIPTLERAGIQVETTQLPSTSPIPGRNVPSFAEKVATWTEFLRGSGGPRRS
jgi:TDG/mug DNA glycosylase family protein